MADRAASNNPVPRSQVVLADSDSPLPRGLVSESLKGTLDALPTDLCSNPKHNRTSIEARWGLKHGIVKPGSDQRFDGDRRRCDDADPENRSAGDCGARLAPPPRANTSLCSNE